jgi:sterol desaturase/sphingolipid hydroxylase (fatty acid hydroxylase superfamily)
MTPLARLFTAEIPDISERWRPLANLYVAGFAVVYAVTFLASLHFVFLGPGLGDEFTLRHLEALFRGLVDWAQATGNTFWLWSCAALVLFHTAFRAVLHWRSWSEYRAGLGEDLPLRDFLTLHLVNVLNALFPLLALATLAGAAALLGYPPSAGSGALMELAQWANALAMQVPTLVTLPNWLALLPTLMAVTLVHYGMHRWSHTRRLLWLLLHRPHHMSQYLAYATTLPVVMAFPLFLLMVVPYVFVFGALGKLFAAEPLYKEMILFQLVVYVGEIYGHSPALYERAIRNPLVRWISYFYTQGVYHVLHHSAAADSARKSNNNTVNIGPGLFCCWDRLFGTYMPLPEKVPPMGLHGQPALHMNPLRLLFAGAAQLAWELWHNRSLRDWWMILAGPSTYTPPHSRDFLLREAVQTTRQPMSRSATA